MAGIAQNGQTHLIFNVVPQVRKKNERKIKQGKKTYWISQRSNTLIYIHLYIYAQLQINIFKYRYTYSNINVMYYSSQVMLFDIMFESKVFASSIESGKLFQTEESMQEFVFCPMFVLQKGFLSLEKLFLVPILQCGANFIQIIRINVIDKIAGYGIYVLINPFTGR